MIDVVLVDGSVVEYSCWLHPDPPWRWRAGRGRGRDFESGELQIEWNAAPAESAAVIADDVSRRNTAIRAARPEGSIAVVVTAARRVVELWDGKEPASALEAAIEELQIAVSTFSADADRVPRPAGNLSDR